jgi:DNA primase
MDLHDYCEITGVSMPTQDEIDKIANNILEDSRDLQKMNWPVNFIPLWDKRSASGVEYINSRGLQPGNDMYYDIDRKGIVFPYYYDSTCVGAQIRFIDPQPNKTKITTVPGTKLGKLFYSWNQSNLPSYTRYIIVTEGAFNSIAIQQVLNRHYKTALKNPYRAIAASGSSIGKHRAEILKELIEEDFKIILAADSDEAGIRMFEKAVDMRCITHVTETGKSSNDWNDLLINSDDDELLEKLLGNLRKI